MILLYDIRSTNLPFQIYKRYQSYLVRSKMEIDTHISTIFKKVNDTLELLQSYLCNVKFQMRVIVNFQELHFIRFYR